MDRRPTSVDGHEFVQVALRATQRSDVSVEAQAALARALDAGQRTPTDVLRELLDGRQSAEVVYDYQTDPRITRFRTPASELLSRRLRDLRPIDAAHFDACWAQRFAELGPGIGEDDLRAYGTMHRRRFCEAANGLALLLADQAQPRVLDCGLSVFLALWKRLLPQIELASCDRPCDAATAEFFARASAMAGATAHVSVDWNEPHAVTPAVRDALGTFDLVVFTEVLEHLTVHPVHVLRNLLSLLRPHGVIYLTTPNRFATSHLRATAGRFDPQQVFPLDGNGGGGHHFHEFCMADVLRFAADAGGAPKAFYFSDCWDETPVQPEDQRSNMVVVFGRA